MENKKIMILAGEASGDMYGAHLVQAMKAQAPQLEFFGMGGPQMAAAGVIQAVDAATVSVVGISEVFSHLPAILRAARILKKTLLTKKPDLLILIDFPDFNFHIAKFAKKLNIKIFYYISPQVWAWRKGRIKTIRKLIDKMMVILPFEVDFYQKNNVRVCFEGHPLIDIVKADTHTLLDSSKRPLIGLLPGSRHGEINRLFPTLLAAAQQLKHHYPEAQFVVPLAPTVTKAMLTPYLSPLRSLPIQFIENQTYTVLSTCDVVIAASGTVTLEAALLETPMVIIYRLKPLSYYLGKYLVKLPFFGLCNLIANEKIVPELLQAEANPHTITYEVRRILDNDAVRQKMKHQFAALKQQLGQTGVTTRIASAALEMILL